MENRCLVVLVPENDGLVYSVVCECDALRGKIVSTDKVTNI